MYLKILLNNKMFYFRKFIQKRSFHLQRQPNNRDTFLFSGVITSLILNTINGYKIDKLEKKIK